MGVYIDNSRTARFSNIVITALNQVGYAFLGAATTGMGLYSSTLKLLNAGVSVFEATSTTVLLPLVTTCTDAFRSSLTSAVAYGFTGATTTGMGLYSSTLKLLNTGVSVFEATSTTVLLPLVTTCTNAFRSSLTGSVAYGFTGATTTGMGLNGSSLILYNSGVKVFEAVNNAVLLPLVTYCSNTLLSEVSSGISYGFEAQGETGMGLYGSTLKLLNAGQSVFEATIYTVLLPLVTTCADAFRSSLTGSVAYGFTGATTTGMGWWDGTTLKLLVTGVSVFEATSTTVLLPLVTTCTNAFRSSLTSAVAYGFTGATTTGMGLYSSTLKLLNTGVSVFEATSTTVLLPLVTTCTNAFRSSLTGSVAYGFTGATTTGMGLNGSSLILYNSGSNVLETTSTTLLLHTPLHLSSVIRNAHNFTIPIVGGASQQIARITIANIGSNCSFGYWINAHSYGYGDPIDRKSYQIYGNVSSDSNHSESGFINQVGSGASLSSVTFVVSAGGSPFSVYLDWKRISGSDAYGSYVHYISIELVFTSGYSSSITTSVSNLSN